MKRSINQIKKYRKRVHEEEVQPSVSQENVAENDADENFTPKRPRIIESNDETTERSRFTRSEPTFAPNNSKSPTLCLNTSKRNEQLNFSTPNDSASLLNASELKEQPIERIKDAFSWLDLKNNSEEKFINEHIFDARSADLELGSLGIDPHDVPSSLISHMNQNLFSTSLTLNQSSASPILSQSIEIDEEPEEDEITDDESFEVSPPKARKSLCCLM
uniref:Uncharacterized protein n=1 Tax=Panagrolaimus superbus TaxID=310955 RepID=A0A914Z348_9BILA